VFRAVTLTGVSWGNGTSAQAMRAVSLLVAAGLVLLALAGGASAAAPRLSLPPLPLPVPLPPLPLPGPSNPAPYGLNDAGGFLNVLPPGEAGVDNAAQLALYTANGTVPPHFNDQAPLYQNLVYADPTLTDAQVPQFFKDATFGAKPADVTGTESPIPGLTIVRDNYDVPHIYAETRAELMYGAGYAGAEDRLFLMDVLRHTAEAQLASFVGGSRSNRQMDEMQWQSAPYTQQDLQSQIDAAPQQYGAAGTQLISDLNSYVDGINGYISQALNPLYSLSLLPGEYAAIGKLPQLWKPTDVIAEASLIGGIFGKGGGNELHAALALQALERRFGNKQGRRSFTDFREANDPEAPTTILHQKFPYETTSAFAKRGLALPDPGSLSFTSTGSPSASAASVSTNARGPLADLGARLVKALQGPTHASNWELVSARHSANGHAIAVMGPQVGYYVPQILMEEDLHGPGIDARGAAFPGVNLYVELGHGRDYAWSATTSTSDNVDTFAEVLCGGDAYHYLYKGQCLPMQKLEQADTWTPNLDDSTPAGSETLTAYRTVHGIVIARGTVHGKPVAYVSARSTYFHEADSALGFSYLNEPGYVHDPASFQQAVSHINFLFNWSYVDANHISYYMSGWMPQRAPGTSPDFPILGTGAYDWKGYDPATHTADWLPFARHPHITDPDYLVSWNNKQAPRWAAADDHWAYGPIYRSQLIEDRIKADIAHGQKMTISQLVQAMEEPATEDIRAVQLLPLLQRAVGKPTSANVATAMAGLAAWHAAGGHRRDLNQDGHDEYTPQIELMDAWWPKLLTAEFQPMLGSDGFGAVQAMTGFGGTDFADGWWGYVSKDLRRLYGKGHERGRYSQIYCGNLPHRHFRLAQLRRRCRALLQSTLAAALTVSPQQTYGAACPKDPEPACSDQNTYTYASAITLPPFPYQNRPTFQQVVTLTQTLPR
jgi:acyl-homoserine lactone acylase PvdQ